MRAQRDSQSQTATLTDIELLAMETSCQLGFLAAALDPASNLNLSDDGRKGAALFARQLEAAGWKLTNALDDYGRTHGR